MQPQTDLERLANRIGSGAFADDLICLCTKVAGLRTQAEKLSLYSHWAAALIISGNKKTKVTGLLHNADMYGNTNKEDIQKKEQLKGEIVVQGRATQFI
jgi:hypothetical protein